LQGITGDDLAGLLRQQIGQQKIAQRRAQAGEEIEMGNQHQRDGQQRNQCQQRGERQAGSSLGTAFLTESREAALEEIG